MIYHYTQLPGVFLVEPERQRDRRGWFARTFCIDEFADLGMASAFAQCSASFNGERGTLRGLHYQSAPAEEAKLVRCVQGAIFDVVVDIRPESPTFRRWLSAELTALNGHMLYVPEGYAHGFQSLANNSEVFYQISVPYRRELARGIRWDDPDIGIDWPVTGPILSDRDRMLPFLADMPKRSSGNAATAAPPALAASAG
jgi:dTDP-4-dehydrorhamnose 3,5-epimerase